MKPSLSNKLAQLAERLVELDRLSPHLIDPEHPSPRRAPEEPTMRYHLPADRMPTAWYNVLPDMPEPLQPPLHPATREPLGPDDLAPLFPMALIGHEMATDPWIDISGEVIDILRLWRPTPLVRAERLERALGTPARIHFKDESVSPAGSHKPNTAVPQAFYNTGRRRPAADHRDRRGSVGDPLAFACRQYEMDCKVYMVRASYNQKPYQKILMEGRPDQNPGR